VDVDQPIGASFDLERLAQLVEALPVGVFILGGDGIALYENQAAQALLGRGISAGDAVPNLGARFSVYRAGTNDLYPTMELPVVRALAGVRVTVDDVEIDRNGQRVALEVTATPILDKESHVEFAVAVFQDITARKEAQRALAAMNEELEREVARRTSDLAETIAALEQEIATRRLYETELLGARVDAERANRAKGVFLMNVSHELRTPLHQIIGFNDLLVDGLTDERSRRLAVGAGISGRVLLDKVDALIDLARADGPQPVVPAVEFDLQTTVAGVAHTFGLPCEFPERLVRVRGNEEGVRQILSDVCRAGLTDARFPDAGLIAKTERQDHSARLILQFRGEGLVRRVEALAGLFGETAPSESGRYQQQPLDLRLAVAQTHARRLGGDIAVTASDAVEVSLPFEM
jgi:signal transduction histidine kinase